MYRLKYPKKISRNPKNINPNPKDSDQREREIRGRERLRPQRPRQTQAATTQVREPQAWVARGLGRPRHTSPRPGLRVAWVCLGRVRWSKATNSDLDLLSLSVSGFFFFFFFLFSLGSSLMFWWFLFDLFLFIRDINRVLETRFPCNHHMEKYATSDVIRAQKSSL